MKLYNVVMEFEYDEDWDNIKKAAKKFEFKCEEKKDSDILQVTMPADVALGSGFEIQIGAFERFMDEVLNPKEQVW